jgi:hypothetical protein
LPTLSIVFVSSLVLAEWASYEKPSAAFYLLPTRCWQLLVGSFAAFYFNQSKRAYSGKIQSEVCGWFGVMLILYAILFYTKNTPFSEIVPFITPPDYYLLYGIIQDEHSQSEEPFEKFIPYILQHSSPERSDYRFDRSNVWYHLILKEYKRGTPIDQLIPFMTEENIPILTLLSTLFSELNIPM